MKAGGVHNLAAHASSVRPDLSRCRFILSERIPAPSNKARISAVRRILCLAGKWNQRGTRTLELVADVLLGLPVLLTLQKLAADPAMDEAHHQLHRYSRYPIVSDAAPWRICAKPSTVQLLSEAYQSLIPACSRLWEERLSYIAIPARSARRL